MLERQETATRSLKKDSNQKYHHLKKGPNPKHQLSILSKDAASLINFTLYSCGEVGNSIRVLTIFNTIRIFFTMRICL